MTASLALNESCVIIVTSVGGGTVGRAPAVGIAINVGEGVGAGVLGAQAASISTTNANIKMIDFLISTSLFK
jgi:hypothetical protein